MTKTVSILGILVALSLALIALIAPPGGGGVMALEDINVRTNPTSTLCAKNAALDEGYGVSRSVTSICAQR